MKNLLTFFGKGIFIFLLFPSFSLLAQHASWNYNRTDGSLSTTSSYLWIDCSTSAGGTEITSGMFAGNADNGRYGLVLPFDFSFYDDNYTGGSDMISICTNGFIRFDGLANFSATAASSYSLSSSATSLGQIIALALYDDLASSSAGPNPAKVYYKVTGTAPNRILTIEYDNLLVPANSISAIPTVDAQVSLYESSYKIVIKIKDILTSQNNVDIGLHSGVSGYYNYYNDVDKLKGDTYIEYTHSKKSVNSITVTQASTARIAPGATNGQILKVKINVNPGLGILKLTDFTATDNAHTSIDIVSSGVKLYATSSSAFSTSNLLGSSTYNKSYFASFSSLNHELSGGDNYLWLTYDLKSTATSGDRLDALIGKDDITIGGSTYPASKEDPAGDRLIADDYTWTGTKSTDWGDKDNWAGGQIPTQYDNVTIPSGTPYSPTIYTATNNACNDILIRTGAALNVTASSLNTNYAFFVHGNFTNNGTLTQGTTLNILPIYLKGSSKTFGGTGTFTNVKFILENASYTLSSNTGRIKKFTLQNGSSLSLSSYTLKSTNLSFGSSSDRLYLNSGTFDLSSFISVNSNSNIVSGTGTFYYSGSSSQTINTVCSYNILEIETPDGITKTLGSGLSCNELYVTNTAATGQGVTKLNADINVSGDVIVDPNCDLQLNGYNLSLTGNLKIKGAYTPGNNTLTFNGTADQLVYSNGNDLKKISIVKSSGNVLLKENTTISDQITFTSGDLDIGNFDLTIDKSTSLTGAGASSHIITSGTGVVKCTYPSVGSFTFPLGDGTNYTPFTFNLTSASIASGAYITMNLTPSASGDLTSTSYINRSWTLEQNGGLSSYNYDVDYYYEQNDVVGNEADIIPTKISGGTIIQTTNANLMNINTNHVSFTGLTSFSEYGARDQADGATILPVNLLSFSAEALNDEVVVKWATATEINSDYFEIQRSADNYNYETIGKVKAAGTSNIPMNYNFNDVAPLEGISYYRLKQVDFDGKFVYSQPVTVSTKTKEVVLWPNPMKYSDINLLFKDGYNGKAEIRIFSATGKEIYKTAVVVRSGIVKVNLPSMKAGVYFIEINTDGKIIRKKFFVE